MFTKIIILKGCSDSTGHAIIHKKPPPKSLSETICYLFRGLSAKGFDTLHAIGLIMSHKWACELVSQISQNALKEAHFLKDRHPWLLSYDNVNIQSRTSKARLFFKQINATS